MRYLEWIRGVWLGVETPETGAIVGESLTTERLALLKDITTVQELVASKDYAPIETSSTLNQEITNHWNRYNETWTTVVETWQNAWPTTSQLANKALLADLYSAQISLDQDLQFLEAQAKPRL
jgi:hypothetical protein